MDDFTEARRETIRYHRALYARPVATGPGSWPARPHRLVIEALGLVPGPVHAYDLGAGTGRHTLLMATQLPAGSHVTAVDLLPDALATLVADAGRAGVGDRVETIAADLETYRFPAAEAGLIVAFSAVEHVSSVVAVAELLDRCRAATLPGGVNVVAVAADRREVTGHGTRPARVECPLTAEQARAVVLSTYRDWEVIVDASAPITSRETREAEGYDLRATLVSVVVRAPSPE